MPACIPLRCSHRVGQIDLRCGYAFTTNERKLILGTINLSMTVSSFLVGRFFCIFVFCCMMFCNYCSVLYVLFAEVHVNLIYRVRWSVVASVQSKMFVLQYAVFLSSMGCTAVNTWWKFFGRCKTEVLWCWCPRCAGWYLACEISRQNPALEAWQCEELAMFINM